MPERPNVAGASDAAPSAQPAGPPSLPVPSARLDPELRFLRGVARRLPDVPRVTGVVNRLIKPLYLRRPRSEVVAPVLDFCMRLKPEEAIDGAYLFYPHLCDKHEVRCLGAFLRPGDTFVDVGAHIGFYSLVAATAVGSRGRVVSVEAEEHNHARLVWNADVNRMHQIRAVRRGVACETGVRALGVQIAGNRGGSSFSAASAHTQEVECSPLLEILAEQHVDRVRGMKLDIEGEEVRVLTQYLRDPARPMWPDLLIVEDSVHASGIAPLLMKHGYQLRSSHMGNAMNRIFVRPSASVGKARPTRGQSPTS